MFCHAPARVRFSLAALSRKAEPADRWSVPGTRTAYLAATPAVAAAEWARHAGADGASADRSIVSLRLQPIPVLDLRGGPAQRDGGPPDGSGPATFLDRDVARRAAEAGRRADVAAILVPSMAFIDRPVDAFNIVLFCDRLASGIESVLCEPRRVGRLRVAATSDGP